MLTFYKRFKEYLNNIAWMVGDRLIIAIIGFCVAIVLARYLGPEKYGLLAYCLSLVALAGIFAHLGLSGLVVKEIVECSDTGLRSEILGTTFGLKIIGATLGFLVTISYTASIEGLGSEELVIVSIVGLTLFLRAADVFDIWFQAVVKARYAAIPKLIAASLGAITKIAAVTFGAGVLLIASVHVLQMLIASVLITVSYSYTSTIKIRSWRFNTRKAKEMLSNGWLIYLGSIFAVIYLKIDQIMLKAMVDNEAVGTYAVAAQISEAWYILPTAIVATIFPRLIKLHNDSELEFKSQLQILFDILLSLALVVAVLVTIFSRAIITLLFGAEYSLSADILVIHIWAALFIFLRTAFSKWILIEKAYVFSLVTQGAGAVSNILLNLVLIPAYGVKGAAMATLVSYAISSYISLLFYSRTRPIFWQMTKSFFSPLRYSVQLTTRRKI